MGFIVTIILVALGVASMTWAAADNRNSFSIVNVKIVKIADDRITVRDDQGKLIVLQVSSELRANRLLRNFKIGDRVRIQIQGNALMQVQQSQ